MSGACEAMFLDGSRQGLAAVDPRHVDRGVLADLAARYGSDEFRAALRERNGWPYPGEENLTGGVADLDDYSACKISRKEDWRDLFVTPFYFGCEADGGCGGAERDAGAGRGRIVPGRLLNLRIGCAGRRRSCGRRCCRCAGWRRRKRRAACCASPARSGRCRR
jgi:hypothetical protein